MTGLIGAVVFQTLAIIGSVDAQQPRPIIVEAEAKEPPAEKQLPDNLPPEIRFHDVGDVTLHVMDATGKPIRPLIVNEKFREGYRAQGTPEISADGRRVAFDTIRRGENQGISQTRIVVVDFEGTEPIDVCDGLMPTFSPDTDFVMCNRYIGGSSLWVIAVDKSDEIMLLDSGVWAGRWSPDGRYVVYYGGNQPTGQSFYSSGLKIYDLNREDSRVLLPPDKCPVQSIDFHIAWHKGPEPLIAFGGPLKDGTGTATFVIDADIGVESLRRIPAEPDGDFEVRHGRSYDWHPSGKKLLMTAVGGGRSFPVEVATDGSGKCERLPNFPDMVSISDPAYTPDGNHIIVSLYIPDPPSEPTPDSVSSVPAAGNLPDVFVVPALTPR